MCRTPVQARPEKGIANQSQYFLLVRRACGQPLPECDFPPRSSRR
jgi:hypothetical protein